MVSAVTVNFFPFPCAPVRNRAIVLPPHDSVTNRSGSGLQNRLDQFDSDRSLLFPLSLIGKTKDFESLKRTFEPFRGSRECNMATLEESYHKGRWCKIIQKTCQEGFCSECQAFIDKAKKFDKILKEIEGVSSIDEDNGFSSR